MRYLNAAEFFKPPPLLDLYVGNDDYNDLIEGIRCGKHFDWMGDSGFLYREDYPDYARQAPRDEGATPKKAKQQRIAKEAAASQGQWEDEQAARQRAKEELADKEWFAAAAAKAAAVTPLNRETDRTAPDARDGERNEELAAIVAVIEHPISPLDAELHLCHLDRLVQDALVAGALRNGTLEKCCSLLDEAKAKGII